VKFKTQTNGDIGNRFHHSNPNRYTSAIIWWHDLFKEPAGRWRAGTMNRKKAVALLALMFSGIISAGLPARADENKDELLRIIRQEDGALQAMAVENLMTLNLSPDWWQYLLKRENKSYRTVTNMADCLMKVAMTLGCEDVQKLDQTRDATSPLVAEAMAKIKGKVNCTIQLTDSVREDIRPKVVENVAMFEAPMTNNYYCKPRGKKLNLFITLDAKGKSLGFQVSKDGNDYRFTVPAYVDLMTSPIQAAFKQGT
jgi:hypothetical protein